MSQIVIDGVEPENWLTFRGDHREAVGRIGGVNASTGQPCTVVAAQYNPAGRGRTRLGFVSGDVRSELGVTDEQRVEQDGIYVRHFLSQQRARSAGFLR